MFGKTLISVRLLRDLLTSMIVVASYAVSSSRADEFAPPLRFMSGDMAARAATFAPDLAFPDKPQLPDEPMTPGQAFLKPAAEGPFPALVIVHQCAGVNPAVATWARESVKRGYVVLMIDSLQSRNVQTLCFGPQAGVNLFRGAKDALQAADFLRRQSFVDPNRVSMVGFSWGGMIGLIAASQRYLTALEGKPFASVTSFYPGCFRISRPNAASFDVVSEDMNQPVLALMGGVDNETPATECAAMLQQARDNGATIDWHIYPNASHCWDCRMLDGRSKMDFRGNHITYKYSEDVTQDSSMRLFKFLDRLNSK